VTEVVKRLSAAERAAMSAQIDRIAQTPVPQLDTQRGSQFVFVAHFDGTNNDKDNLALSGSKLTTNVAQLHEQMQGQNKANPNFESVYYRGVGTDPGLEGGIEATVAPSKDMRETADQAYKDFHKQALTWLKAHPEANPAESLQVMATGFSRGAGTAAVFSQMLHERGLTDPATGKALIPPGQLGLAGALVLDPVTTAYDRNSAFSPESKNITVVQAQHEYRSPFKGVDHSGHPQVRVVPVTGNHCDIGGGYDNGIAARVLESSTVWMKKAGVPIAEVPPERRHDGTAVVHHERDLPKTAETAQVARSPLLRAAFPLGSRLVEGAAQQADYPLTHDPRNGLNAPRLLVQSATEETRLANGWGRFEAAESTVWRKDFSVPGQGGQGGKDGITIRASVVEPHLKASDNQRRLDMHLHSVGRDGQVMEHLRVNADGRQPAAVMQAVDQRLGARSPVVGAAVAPVSAPLHPALRQLSDQLAARGFTPDQVQKISDHAREQVGVQAMDQLRHAALHKDGQSVALVFREQPFKGFAIEDALSGRGRTDGAATHHGTPTATSPQLAPQLGPPLSTQGSVQSWSRAEPGAYAR
jgi:hypothetical protein